MKDQLGRDITYLRISLTDLCNLRCLYCMPEEGVTKLAHGDILSFEEIAEAARAAAGLGIKKIRLTGGEPLIRRGVVSLCRELAAIPGIDELALTTNGIMLPALAHELKAAGVSRVNISLDTLDANKYRRITRGGSLSDAFEGIRAAFDAGLTPVKLNAVLMGGVNDDEIQSLALLSRRYPVHVRFIELMPMVDAAFDLGPDAYIPCNAVLERCPDLEPLSCSNGVAALYAFPGAPGTVGLIRPLSCSFCAQCSRLRITADGYLKPCLHSAEEIPIRGLHGEALTDALRLAVMHKPAQHGRLSADSRTASERGMNAIGG